MVRERDRPRSQLSESWVVEAISDGKHTPTANTNARQSGWQSAGVQEELETLGKISSWATGRAGAEPELIMPSINGNEMSGSGYGEERPRIDRGVGRKLNQAERRAQSHDGSEAPQQPESYSMQNTVTVLLQECLGFIKPMCSWTYDVLGGALQALKTPISFLIATWLLVGSLVLLRNLLFSSVYSALSPLCRIPGSSLLNLSMCQTSVSQQYSSDDRPSIMFDKLMTVQNKFDEVLQESAVGVSLPLDMKRGETSIRDLRQVVRFSQLPSKNELVLEFDGFIETARIASYDLQKFNSHVGRGVDNILATARWTKRVLDGIAERDASHSAIASFITDKLLAPFQPTKNTENILLDQYIQHTRIVEEEVIRLVAEAQALLMVLQNLEDRLDVVHGIAVRDNIQAEGSRVEILSQLWTMLGGNRNKLGKFDSQLRLLGQVNTYRRNAIAHVSGTVIKLQRMGAELEELRERVGSVELLDGNGKVPLSVHIENIELGVERLEKCRKGAKEIENNGLKKSLEKGQGADRMIEGG